MLLELEQFPTKPETSKEDELLLCDTGECCICFSLRLEDLLPEIICQNPSCKQYFHKECLYQVFYLFYELWKFFLNFLFVTATLFSGWLPLARGRPLTNFTGSVQTAKRFALKTFQLVIYILFILMFFCREFSVPSEKLNDYTTLRGIKDFDTCDIYQRGSHLTNKLKLLPRSLYGCDYFYLTIVFVFYV